jgi:RNA polymerase sigma-70 factor (ECF subfamily)
MTDPLTRTPTPPASLGAADDVARAAAGDRHAFERLYTLHLPRVFSLCCRMVGDRGKAEDLTQDVFVRCWEKLHTFRGDAAFATWLHRLAVNVVLTHHDTEGRWRSRHATDESPTDTVATADTHASVSPDVALDLEAAIATLPRGARTVFVLHDVEGYTHEEIGTMLGVTPGGCKAQLHRARMLLRERLTR